ncbi:S-layer homology domain-containing protein [Paenibacillus sp. NEAU-GSW1]|uniref:S-layer homology domain-containing protein n=1 Tax=Paenibacillus sp. NEAU-GSW1 TaxID=2682486 RepID=UPI0012E2DE84|nr:S-layer homology domain-containing protein [Paenibacillus sp. NEAU-GSW1]MUT66510.1 hypothetical protein [Paenibacillus sp. NEAU-GSW1]
MRNRKYNKLLVLMLAAALLVPSFSVSAASASGAKKDGLADGAQARQTAMNVSGDTLQLGGNGNPIQIIMDESGKIAAYLKQGGAYVNQYYSSYGWGTNLFVNMGGEDKYYTTPYYGGEWGAYESVKRPDDNTIEMSWLFNEGQLRVKQTIRYIPGDWFYEKSWTLENTTESETFTGLKWIHGGDAYFGGIDSARAYWNDTLGMVYLRNDSTDDVGIMGYYGSEASKADGYAGGDYSAAYDQAMNGQLNNELINNGDYGYIDAGYQLQWNHDSLAPGEAWSIVSYERWTDAGGVQVLAPENKKVYPGETATYSFLLLNLLEQLGDGDVEVPMDAEFDVSAASENGWDVTIDSPTHLAISGGEVAQVNVTVTVPEDTDLLSDKLTLTAVANTEEAPTGSGYVRTIIPNDAPTASDLAAAGKLRVGQTLTASYAYADTEDDEEGTSKFQWYIADNAEGDNRMAIADATGKTYKLHKADVGKYISFSVVPVAAEGTAAGEQSDSEWVGPVAKQQTTPTESAAPTEELIVIDVEDGADKDGEVVSKAFITRTTDLLGNKKDEVKFTMEQAADAIQQLQTADSKSAKLVIPDPKDEVSELLVNLPKESLALLAANGVSLEIASSNGSIILSAEEMKGLTEDAYFRLIPIKKESERKEALNRARTEQLVLALAGTNAVSSIGRPLEIETNVQSHRVTLVFPLGQTELSEDELNELGVFVEHSDGDKELIKGEIVGYGAEGAKGLQITVNKFSAFTIVHIPGWGDEHKPYITGYADGTFRPERNLTRAEMAVMLSRIFAADEEQDGKQADSNASSIVAAEDAGEGGLLAPTFLDVGGKHWAAAAIGQTAALGLMQGYADGSFKPEQQITRAEMASIVAKWLAEASSGTAAGFADSEQHWAAEAIGKVTAAGIMQGYADGSFKPDQALTRAEAVTLLNKVLGRGPLNDGDARWSDVAEGYWAFGDIQEASIDHKFEAAEK